MKDQLDKLEFKGEVIAPEGLGFGEGSISVVARLEDPEDPLTPQIMGKVDEILTGKKALVPKETDDDGCPDGRGVGRILKGLTFINESFHRAKVFGGGLTMGVSARIGLGQAKTGLKKLFKSESKELRNAGLDYGAHTAAGAPDNKSGCGAIDESPVIVGNVPNYREDIKATVGGLSVILEENDVNTDEIYVDEVIDNYEGYKENYIVDENYAGKEVMEEVVLEDEKVVKELEGPHLEVAIAINTVKDMTVDQELIRSETDGIAQVFVVDLWRIVEIADKRYKDPQERSKAVISMLAYSLSTAATLTDGTLPVYLIKSLEETQKAN
ncbi:MAG TPA: hypothetical protein VD947_03720 [Patescibacteria group bacterium]|nr:hypothetical protein [Patescibacteria group bacterium]